MGKPKLYSNKKYKEVGNRLYNKGKHLSKNKAKQKEEEEEQKEQEIASKCMFQP